jgi:hypothetical protein
MIHTKTLTVFQRLSSLTERSLGPAINKYMNNVARIIERALTEIDNDRLALGDTLEKPERKHYFP